jgi:hypothetical protein
MTLATLCRFLVGDRRAILDIGATRGAWRVGIVLVLSAGLAREYDHEDLLHEPWHALLPLAASLATATLLYALIRVVAWRRSGTGWPAQGGYPAFLGLYWATAPLAWLYAIPVERFLPADRAVAANLWLLSIVSVWRVLLMTRVVGVVWRCHGWEAFQIVGLFAWSVATAVLSQTPLPLLSIMGGIELAPAEAILAETTFLVTLCLFLSSPFWVICGLAILLLRRQAGGPWTPDDSFASGSLGVARSLWAFSGLAVAVGLSLLPLSQPEQRLRHAAEGALLRDDPEAAIRLMAAHDRADFPPHWDPPPRPGFGERKPRLTDIVEAIATVDPPAWVREIFFAKATNAEYPAWDGGPLLRLDDEALARYVAVLERIPEGQRLAAIHAASIDLVLRRDTALTPELAEGTSRRDLLERVRTLAGTDGAETTSPSGP